MTTTTVAKMTTTVAMTTTISTTTTTRTTTTTNNHTDHDRNHDNDDDHDQDHDRDHVNKQPQRPRLTERARVRAPRAACALLFVAYTSGAFCVSVHEDERVRGTEYRRVIRLGKAWERGRRKRVAWRVCIQRRQRACP